MKVRYTLTWEEYLEAHSRAIPKPQITSFIGAVFIAVALGIYGGLVLYVVDAEDRAAASVLCFLALGVLLIAVWDLKVRTNVRKKRFLEKLRTAYDGNHRREVAFGFDEEKWVHETPEGTHESPWVRLEHAVEQPNTVALWTKNYFAIVPKRILTSSTDSPNAASNGHFSLEALRKSALGADWNIVPCRLAFTDYALTEAAEMLHRHTFLMLIGHAAGFTGFLWILNHAYHNPAPGELLGYFVASFLFLVTMTAVSGYLLIRHFLEFGEVRRKWEVGFSDRGIFGRDSKMDYFTAWAAFSRFAETRRCVLLYTDGTQYYIFPKRCLSVERQTSLGQLLQAKLSRV